MVYHGKYCGTWVYRVLGFAMACHQLHILVFFVFFFIFPGNVDFLRRLKLDKKIEVHNGCVSVLFYLKFLNLLQIGLVPYINHMSHSV